MEKELERVTAVLDAIQDGIYVVNQDYILEFMNAVMVRNFGGRVGQKCHQVVNHSKDICPWCRAQEVFEGAHVHSEVYMPVADRIYRVTDIPMRHRDGTVSKVSICQDLPQRSKRAANPKASPDDYQSLIEHVGCGVYLSSREGRILDANRALLDMLGYEDKTEFWGLDVCQDLYLSPENYQVFQVFLARDGQVIDYEVDLKRKDGRRLTVLLTSHPRYDRQGKLSGYEGIVVDLSQRIQIENRLRASEEDYIRLFENIPCGVFISSKEGKFLDANQALLDMLGYKSKEEFLKIDIAQDLYLNPGERRRFQEMIEREGHVIDYEVEFKRKDGSTVPVLLTGHVRYDSLGKIVSYEGLNVDQTQRKLMEKEI
ncbi:MAG: PAS domain-containing protein, partial [Desulfobacterales bacterium]